VAYLVAAEPPHAHQGRVVPLPLPVHKAVFHNSQHDVVHRHVTGRRDEDVGLFLPVGTLEKLINWSWCV
jgi:hypothetical protein